MNHNVRTYVRHPLALGAAVLLALLCLYYPAVHTFGSAGDVKLYQRYGVEALGSPISLPTEYPALTAALFVLPQLIAPTFYTVGFAFLAALAVAATVIVVERLGGRGWLLLVLLVLAGWGTLFFRYDIYVILVTVLAYACAARRRWYAAQALLALGVALKLYPVMLMALVVIAECHQARRLPWRSALWGGALLALALGGTWLAAPAAGSQVVGLLGARPLQFEAVGASLAWLFGPTSTELTFGSVNLVSPLAPFARTLLTAASFPALLTAYWLFLTRRIKAAQAWALTLVVLIATSKVFSTQYVLWALPFVALALPPDAAEADPADARDDRWLWVAICLLSGLVFPFGERFNSRTAQLALAAVRNALWVVAAFRLAERGVAAGVLRRTWRGLVAQLVRVRRRPWPALALLGLLLVADMVRLRGAATSGTFLDIGGWNDEEIVRLRGFYLPESTVGAVSYRWSSERSVLRIRSSAATNAPIAMVLWLGGLPQPDLASVVVGLVLDNAAALELDVPQTPRQFHVLVPPVADDGGVASYLSSATERVGADPRALGVRVDGLDVSMLGSGLIVPTWQTLVGQLAALLGASAAVRWFGGRRARWLLPPLAVALAIASGMSVWAPWAWQSRVIVAGVLALLGTWGLDLGRRSARP